MPVLKLRFTEKLNVIGVNGVAGSEIGKAARRPDLQPAATEAFNQGRLVTARNPAIRDLLRGMEYSAVIDSRTTEICRFLDGKVIPMDEPELDRLSPPNHFNCRSVLVPVTLDMTVNATDMITPSQIGTAEELTPVGFK